MIAKSSSPLPSSSSVKKTGKSAVKKSVKQAKNAPAAKKRKAPRRKTHDSTDDEEEEKDEESDHYESEEVIAQGIVALPPPPAYVEPGKKNFQTEFFCVFHALLFLLFLVYFMSAVWPYESDSYVIGWYSFPFLGDFSVQKADENVNAQTALSLMADDFGRCFPWQTGKQFVSLRMLHSLFLNVHKTPVRWMDLWTFSYESVWQNLPEAQDKASWCANRRYFLEQTVVAKWLVNNGEHCLVHIMIDQEDTYYNRVDVGFYVYPVREEPTFFVEDSKNHAKYPWKSNGEHGWAAICATFSQRVDFSIIEIEEEKQ